MVDIAMPADQMVIAIVRAKNALLGELYDCLAIQKFHWPAQLCPQQKTATQLTSHYAFFFLLSVKYKDSSPIKQILYYIIYFYGGKDLLN